VGVSSCFDYALHSLSAVCPFGCERSLPQRVVVVMVSSFVFVLWWCLLVVVFERPVAFLVQHCFVVPLMVELVVWVFDMSVLSGFSFFLPFVFVWLGRVFVSWLLVLPHSLRQVLRGPHLAVLSLTFFLGFGVVLVPLGLGEVAVERAVPDFFVLS